MAEQEQEQEKQSNLGVILAFVCSGLALTVFVATQTVPQEAQARWADYYRAYHNASAAVLVAGILWFVLALLKAKTNFFVVDHKIGSKELSISIVVLVIVVVVVFYLALSHLPALTPVPEVQMDPAERVRLIKIDKGLAIFVWSVILLTGLLISSLPLRRYFRK